MVGALTLFGLLGSFAATATEVVAVPPWQLHSSFWMSLHQRLIDDATRSSARPLTELSPEEQAAWSEAVSAYRTAGGRGNITFAGAMQVITSELTKRLLAERGHTSFVPSSADMFTRVWPTYRGPLEEYWIAYLDGEGTLEEAIDEIVGAIQR